MYWILGKLVTGIGEVANFLRTCYGEVASLLRTCYGDTVVMHFGLYAASGSECCNTDNL